MDELSQCLENFKWNCIWDYTVNVVFDSLAERLIVGLFIIGTGTLLYKLIAAYRIARKLTKGNRPALGKAGTHAADMFMRIWNSEQNFFSEVTISGFMSTSRRVTRIGLIAEQHLMGIGLVKKVETYQPAKLTLHPERNFKNRLVYRFVKWRLVNIFGDDPIQYKYLEQKRQS